MKPYTLVTMTLQPKISLSPLRIEPNNTIRNMQKGAESRVGWVLQVIHLYTGQASNQTTTDFVRSILGSVESCIVSFSFTLRISGGFSYVVRA